MLGAYSATDVILSGGSAGGIGTFSNIDYVAERLKNSRVNGNPWAGWYFPNVTSYFLWQQNKTFAYTDKALYVLYKSYLNRNCVAQHPKDQWYCGPLNVQKLYPYIKTPLFVAENMFDSNQLFSALGCPKEVSSNLFCNNRARLTKIQIKTKILKIKKKTKIPMVTDEGCNSQK